MKFCPRPGCYRTGKAIGTCGNHVTPCPPPQDVNPDKHVVVTIERKTFAIPVVEAVKKVVGYQPQSDDPETKIKRFALPGSRSPKPPVSEGSGDGKLK